MKPLVLPAQLSSVEKICGALLEPILCGLSDKDRFNLSLLLREALNNAVIHGSQGDDQKHISFSYEDRSDTFWFRIADQGSGFDWNFQKSQSPSIEKSDGRGFPIFLHYSQSFHYNKKGNCLEIIYRFYDPRRNSC